jgi:hypothetical protein
MKMFSFRGGGALLVGLFLLAGFAQAAVLPFSGFATTGAGVLTFQNGGVNYIDWCPVSSFAPSSTIPAGAQGSCPVADTGNGIFLASGGFGAFTPQNPLGNPANTGTILDMKDQAGGNAQYTTFPPNTPVSINNFLRLNSQSNFNFQANILTAGACSSVAIGPFCLTQVGPNVSVTMTVLGTLIDTSGFYDPAPFSDVITGQFNNTTIAAVAAAAQTSTGIFSNSWSGSVEASGIPEPSTWAMMLIGGGLIFAARRRRVH